MLKTTPFTRLRLLFILSIHYVSSDKLINNACSSWNDYWTPIATNPCCYYENDADLTISDIIWKYGHKPHATYVTTEDGYLLPVYRILHANGEEFDGPPLLLAHGSFMNAAGFLLMANESLPFMFAQAGYDVWLVNFRGTYDSTHMTYTRAQAPFWLFSMHEIGVYDVRALIAHVYKQSARGKVVYVGYSMGTCVAYIYASMFPGESTERLAKIVSLAPTAYWKHARSLVHHVYAAWPPVSRLYEQNITSALNVLPVVPALFTDQSQNKMLATGLTVNANQLTMAAVKAAIGLVVGPDYAQYSPRRTSTMLVQMNDAIAFRVMEHYGQIARSDRFAAYDYGVAEANRRHYGTPEVPEYAVEEIRVPMLFVTADNDYCSSHQDALKLYQRIRAPKLYVRLGYANFCHLDYVAAMDAPNLYINDLISTWIHTI